MKEFLLVWFFNFLDFILELFELILWAGPFLLAWFFAWPWAFLYFLTIPLFYTLEPEDYDDDFLQGI